MFLHGLVTDVLLRIFEFTDVTTILSLSRVNKSFHEISKTKQLWIRIVQRLGAEGLDAPPDQSNVNNNNGAGGGGLDSRSLYPPCTPHCFALMLSRGTDVLCTASPGDAPPRGIVSLRRVTDTFSNVVPEMRASLTQMMARTLFHTKIYPQVHHSVLIFTSITTKESRSRPSSGKASSTL
ncbi:hypothetical protein C8R43DRAFT_1044198 [Mycena crocata]|nr:hypothetical protein C8R43DRAFT_1044198 [Mycena crocata]